MDAAEAGARHAEPVAFLQNVKHPVSVSSW